MKKYNLAFWITETKVKVVSSYSYVELDTLEELEFESLDLAVEKFEQLKKEKELVGWKKLKFDKTYIEYNLIINLLNENGYCINSLEVEKLFEEIN